MPSAAAHDAQATDERANDLAGKLQTAERRHTGCRRCCRWRTRSLLWHLGQDRDLETQMAALTTMAELARDKAGAADERSRTADDRAAEAERQVRAAVVAGTGDWPCPADPGPRCAALVQPRCATRCE